MAVYVDDVQHRFGNMLMCHMWADTERELLEMADRIGVQRKWIQGHPTLSFGKHRNARWVHFDIALTKKAKAIKAGAILTDMFGPLEHQAHEAIRSGDEARKAAGREMLDRISKSREIRRLERIDRILADF